jgi:tRNA U55 pseudouridine synthase TruB
LAADIGGKLGCGAVLFDLRRTFSGKFSLEDVVTVETLKSWEQADLEIHLRNLLFEKISKLVIN